mmetsp:Transcript_24998/g.71872  ORF Transcript_24998/g.71872 Transcript_24998/m.71872 type:complete len:360 (-) Transcript_24998:1877-2956(-)
MGLARDFRQACDHGGLDLAQPLLDVPLLVPGHHVDGSEQVDDLALDGHHRFDNLVLVIEADGVDTLKTLPHVRLHGSGILRLRQDHQQLVVRQEEESRKRKALGLEIVVQALLNRVQDLVGIRHICQQAFDVGNVEDVRILHHSCHRRAPERINALELLGLGRHLADNILGTEDGLEVEPSALHRQPLLKKVLDVDQLRLPILDLLLDGLDKGRAAHCLGLNDVVVQQCLHIVDALDQVGARLLVIHVAELHLLPLLLHSLHCGLQAVLFPRLCADRFDDRHVVEDALIQKTLEGQGLALFLVGVHLFKQFCDVMRLDGLLAERGHHRHEALKGHNILLEGLRHILLTLRALEVLVHFV